MFESIKRTLLAAMKVLTPDEVRAIIEELKAEGQLTEDQAEKLLDALLHRGRKESDDVAQRLGKEFQRLADLLPLVTRMEFRELTDRVRRIEERLGPLPEAPEELPPSPAEEEDRA